MCAQPSLWHKFWEAIIDLLAPLLAWTIGLIGLIAFFITLINVGPDSTCREQLIKADEHFESNRRCNSAGAHIEPTTDPNVFRCACPVEVKKEE